MPEELGVEAAQRAGAGALVLGLRESSTKRRAVTDGAIRASEFCMLTGLIGKDSRRLPPSWRSTYLKHPAEPEESESPQQRPAQPAGIQRPTSRHQLVVQASLEE